MPLSHPTKSQGKTASAMEAGIEPAEPTITETTPYNTAVNLCDISISLIHNLKVTCLSKAEYAVKLNLLNTVNSHMQINLQIARYDRQNIYSTDHFSKLLQFQIALWKQLTSVIFSTAARQKIFTFLINLEKLHTSITQNNNTEVTVTTNTFS